MLQRKNESFDDYQKRMERRADILFPTMKDKNKSKILKNLPLGKSIYDEDDDDDFPSVKNIGKIKSELEPLVEAVKKEKNSEQKSRKDRTPEEEEEFLNDFYPSMKHLGKDKVNKTDDEISISKQNNRSSDDKHSEKYENDKKGTFTGGAAKISNNKDILKELGIDKNDEKNKDIDFSIKDKSISATKKRADYEVINNVKYPRNSSNEKVENLKDLAKKDRSERLKEDNTEYLKNNAKKEQFVIDHIDNKAVKWGAKKYKNVDEAVENLHMSKANSYLNTEYAKKQKILNNYKEYPKNLHGYFEDKIGEQRGKDALNKTPGVYIDSDIETLNSLKTALLKDSDFTDKLKKYNNAMKKGYSVNDSINFEDKNWHAAIGNADIRDMHINKNGDIELHIADIYDFNEGEKDPKVRAGRDRQDKGKIKPYCVAYRVIIPKNEAEQIFN